MTWTSVLETYGFKKPYNFPVVLLVVMGIGLFSVTLIASIVAYFSAYGYALSFEEPRFSYFSYVAALGLLAALLAPRKKIALFIFVIGTFELGLGIGLATINKFGISLKSLMPEAPSNVSAGDFSFHSLLVGIPKPNFSYSGNSRQLRIIHNEHGQRAVETSSDNAPHRIAVFGGSSTYDIGLSNPNTWTEILASELGNAFQVRNNGVVGYGTAEHLIQTAFYIDRGFERNPNCALYYVGWNDIRNIALPDVDSGFANYHGLSKFDTFRLTTGDFFSPLATLLTRVTSTLFIPRVTRYNPSDVKTLTDEDISNSKALEFSVTNLANIVALNESRGISTIFVPQIMNSFRLVADTSYGWMPRLADKDVMRVLGHFNKRLEALASDTTALFIPVAQSKFVEEDFVDLGGHFSEAGARKFVSLLAERIRTSCGPQR